MKRIFSLIVLFTLISNAQVRQKNTERFPVFPACEGMEFAALETCFYNQVQDFVYNNFKVPDNLKQGNFKGHVIVLFEVTDKGNLNQSNILKRRAALVEELYNKQTDNPLIVRIPVLNHS